MPNTKERRLENKIYRQYLKKRDPKTHDFYTKEKARYIARSIVYNKLKGDI